MTFKSHPAADLFSPIQIEHDPSRAAVAIVNFWEIILKSRRKTLTKEQPFSEDSAFCLLL
jgi:PIN domain nuclease of toxin-antitoxin system